MSDIQLPITGGCICKAIRYSASAPPVGSRQCWCRDCQYFGSGSSTVNVIFNTADVTITGESSTFVSLADSGRHGDAWLLSDLRNAGDERVERAPAFSDPARRHARSYRDRNACNEHLERSAPHWAHLDPDVPSTPAQPAALPASR